HAPLRAAANSGDISTGSVRVEEASAEAVSIFEPVDGYYHGNGEEFPLVPARRKRNAGRPRQAFEPGELGAPFLGKTLTERLHRNGTRRLCSEGHMKAIVPQRPASGGKRKDRHAAAPCLTKAPEPLLQQLQPATSQSL